MQYKHNKELVLKSFYEPEFSDNVFLINHHLSHAYSAFYPSEFDNAAILIMDGAGDFVSSSAAETTSFWVGEKNKIDHVQTICGECISKDILIDRNILNHVYSVFMWRNAVDVEV